MTLARRPETRERPGAVVSGTRNTLGRRANIGPYIPGVSPPSLTRFPLNSISFETQHVGNRGGTEERPPLFRPRATAAIPASLLGFAPLLVLVYTAPETGLRFPRE